MTFRTSLTHWLILGLFFSIVAGVQARTGTLDDAGPLSAYLNPPPEQIEYFAFGFKESMADSLWLRWIQSGDECQTYAGVRPEQIEVEPGLAADFNNPRHRHCDNSWSFKMLDAVTRLDPRFKMPYLAGTMTLAVLVEDYTGATTIFERGIATYPDDWQILYRAGYHYLFDLKDIERAGDLMSRAADHGAPYWVKLLAVRLYSRVGRTQMGITMLEGFLKTLKEDDQRAAVTKRINDLKRDLATNSADGP